MKDKKQNQNQNLETLNEGYTGRKFKLNITDGYTGKKPNTRPSLPKGVGTGAKPNTQWWRIKEIDKEKRPTWIT